MTQVSRSDFIFDIWMNVMIKMLNAKLTGREKTDVSKYI